MAFLPSPEEFRQPFPDGLVTFAASIVTPLRLSAPDTDWLVSVGLPRSAAPFLNFGGKHEIELPTLSRLWNLPEKAGGLRYRAIGSNGYGDAICLDMDARGAVVYLNHDNGLSRVLINSSVRTLAASLLGFNRLVTATLKERGPKAFIKGEASEAALGAFVTLLQAQDPSALVKGTMWANELERLGRPSDTA